MRARAALLLALLLAAPAYAANASVTVSDNQFSPGTVTIDPGESVTWTRAAGSTNPHTISSDGGDWEANFTTSSTRTFPNPGTYKYWCNFHGAKDSGMHGTVVVTGASASPKPKPTTASPKPSSTSPRPTATRTTAPPTRSPSAAASASPSASPSPIPSGSSVPASVTPTPSPSQTGTTLEDLPSAKKDEPRTALAVILALVVAAAGFGGAAYLLRRRA